MSQELDNHVLYDIEMAPTRRRMSMTQNSVCLNVKVVRVRSN